MMLIKNQITAAGGRQNGKISASFRSRHRHKGKNVKDV
jgi:hypothetical protein